ncbi:hypothetical protein NE865_16252 [Phthorimaea operculella]|nr:hypothetical protein NE865_16252 [Phthorimaea operculella]
MLALLTIILAYAAPGLAAYERPFNITELIVPKTVPPDQSEVEIECRYDANFTLLNWFKGPNEFFRYRPGTAPSTRTFPILGVGKIEMVACGPTACRLRLGALTEDASGLYRCDIERDTPPYKFEARSAQMHVHGHQTRRPVIEGLADEFGEEEEMHAYCRGAPESEIRWYINSREVEEMRGSPTFTKNASRLFFMGIPPTITVQCAELRFGKLSGSKEAKAYWKIRGDKDERPQEQRNASSTTEKCLALIGFLCFICNGFI